ncbi:TrkH family potassium uptake protein [Daejeonella lutea]|uniref:Potassium uptake protein, TrkH family n=1 Tax=Daejeonella lutea TaxID=572036 RepID=A0A1T5AND2_9SPHI|nr:potassium transporter TrkG [Daejeonella lutea]SKB36524.1 potassium uptake protein, TrkH family [Daejeonella lutea]
MKYLNPSLIFILSFLFLIIVGAGLLMLPAASKSSQVNFVDALFMSASAVCVTGLAVFDLNAKLSLFGLNVILVLIQLGGLGIMTFTTFLGYLISGKSSYKDQIMFSQLLNHNKLGSVIKALIKIVILTLAFELAGVALIFSVLDDNQFGGFTDKLFFSIFHSVSAFCNAGFSTLPLGFYDENFRYNYPLHLIIATLLILGGLGFTIILNVQVFISRWAVLIYNLIRFKRKIKYKAWVMTFNSRLIAYTTFALLVFGFVAFFILEYDHTLAAHPTLFGKIVTAFFTSATPRTAGFNTVDLNSLAFPSITIMMVLMWIGASPGSTGGGVRTTTFAVAALNIVNSARSFSRIYVFNRQISSESLKKAFAIISLSILWLGVSIFILSITDGEKGLKALAFESVSAYSTVGLSLGITSVLSTGGKIIILFTMFLGRVGTITLLVALVNSVMVRHYEYPKENVIF